MTTGKREDPLGAHSFAVELDGITAGNFMRCEGLNMASEVQEYMEGGYNMNVRKLIGPSKQSNIVLSKGVSVSRELLEWYVNTHDVSKPVERKNGSVILLDTSGKEILRWNFFRAWPCRWQGPSLSSEASMPAVETLEIAHEGLERA